MAQPDHLRDLNTLNKIITTLNQAVDVRGTLKTCLAQLVELLGLRTGWIFLRDPSAQDRWAGRGYILATHYNLPPAMFEENPEAWDGGCDCQGLCNAGKLTEGYNEVRCSRLGGVEGDRQNLAVHASVPLRSGDSILGILNVAAPNWELFTPHALALLTNLGSQIGVALERARLYDLLQERRILEQAMLLDFSNQLLTRREPGDLMNYLTEEVRRLLQVDACALLLPDEKKEYFYFQAASGWQSNPVGNQYRVPADERSGSGRVMRTQRPLLMEDLNKVKAPNRWMADWLATEGFQAAAIVPLVVDGRSIGTLVIDTRHPRRFDMEELRFMQLMANQAAIALERARLRQEEIKRHRLEEELAVGRQIQFSMLPLCCPVIPGWEFAATYEPAREVGGDFYDFFPLPGEPGRLGLLIADVAGKGVPAALFMALSRTIIRNNVLRGRQPADALIWANRFIQEDSHADMFLTVFYGELDTRDGRFTFVNAGHNRPLWWEAATSQFHELRTKGIVIGILPTIELEERQITLSPGDSIVFYTDGVTEALNSEIEEFGEKRLEATLSTVIEADPQTMVDSVLTAVKQFSGNTPLADDFTLFVVKRKTN